jgi:DNA-directed RNA polymerase subunit N (RpoN/RPB10)
LRNVRILLQGKARAQKMFPVRCYTCNAVIGNKHVQYETLKRHKNDADVLALLNVHRMCCRRMFLGHTNLIDEQVQYGNHDTIIADGIVLKRHVQIERKVSCD